MRKFKHCLCLIMALIVFISSGGISNLITVYASSVVSEYTTDVDIDTIIEREEKQNVLEDVNESLLDSVTSIISPSENFNEDILSVPEAENEVSESVKTKGMKYDNYLYGDPAYSGNYVYDIDSDGNEILEMYECDLDVIIAMAEEGMDLSNFFRGTIFRRFTVEDLFSMKIDGYTFDDIILLYTRGETNIPNWLLKALDGNDFELTSAMVLDSEESSGTAILTGQDWSPMSQYALGVVQCLGGSKAHGNIGKLRAIGDDGITYEVFCLSYGGSYKGGYVYEKASYADCATPNGVAITSDQATMLKILTNVYLNMSGLTSYDYSATQLMMWYIINNVQSIGQLSSEEMYADLISIQRSINGDAPQMEQYLEQYIQGNCLYIQLYFDGYGLQYDGTEYEVFFWRSGPAPNAQNILSWGDADVIAGENTIPYIDNFYLEKEAITEYHVELTKESIITNELLEDFQFEVVESEASGYDLTYDYIRGTYSEDGQTYLNANINSDSFGQTIYEKDPVPYMDDDVEPSGGQHCTIIITDENGYASTTFRHKHTFKEFYSKCYEAPDIEITYESYKAHWTSVLEQAQLEGKLVVNFMGVTQTMTYEEILGIYNSQQVVYTQTEAEATETVNNLYDAYCARTYTYTVTELDTYTRLASSDSNDKILSELTLPKEGYRKNVNDATTISVYQEVLSDGGTMVAGGKNDADENTEEVNITNEPWYNQIFIHKTDLESNNQILYDTEFEIYEYYQYKVKLTSASYTLYPAQILTQFLVSTGSSVIPEAIASATLVVTDASGNEVLRELLDVEKLVAALSTPSSFAVNFSSTYSGNYIADLQLSLDDSMALDKALKKYVYNGTLTEIGICSCENFCEKSCSVCTIGNDYCSLMEGDITAYTLYAKERTREEIISWDNDNNTITTSEGVVYTIIYEDDARTISYTYTDTEGTHSITNIENDAYIEQLTDSTGVITGYQLRYLKPINSGITIFSNGTKICGLDEKHNYVKVEISKDNTYILYYYATQLLENGNYNYQVQFSISPNSIVARDIDRNVNTDPNDYTTWGQDNYEIVRVTAEIAQQMGWSDTTIGMYTVHRLSATDQYCGTTFTNHHEESNKDYQYGYDEYGTLYYTQANQGRFAIVEKTAPSDDVKTGYLGNYKDREYTKLNSESQKKNNDGVPYETDDEICMVKMVHYINLCTDTNQYGTYMLTDGYKEYDSTYYSNYVENIKSDRNEDVETEDGYDAHYFEQSSQEKTIALERYTLLSPLDDVLNTYWDKWFSEYLTRKSGITILRNSHKTDAWMELLEKTSILHHYVGTTINIDSFDDNDSTQSDIVYEGTYTETAINYNSYAGDRAQSLNNRDGFNSVEYLQVGDIIYDNGASEKKARYYKTEASVSKEDGYAFIDEREYGYIRFTKYDMDAQRYVTGDLNEGYEAGTDHADADLDGAVYSLYVDESNFFDVEYFEGNMGGKLFWAQPLNSGGYRIIWDGDENSENGFTDFGSNLFEDYPHAYVTENMELFLDYYDENKVSILVVPKTTTYIGIQHPDGQYGGAKHNGFYAVLEEQQVFVDTNQNGYAETWTLQDVTLYAGAKVASAVIVDGELEINGLYLGTYYLTEEIRDAITIYSTDNDDVEFAENRWLSFAAGYTADTDEYGNPIKYVFYFTYVDKNQNGTFYEAEQDYVHKDTQQVSNQKIIRGGSAQFNKITTNGEGASSGNTTGEALEGAGFTVFMLSELSLIVDGTIVPAYSEIDGHELVEANALVKLFDAAGNMVGYEFTKSYMKETRLDAYFDEKYPEGYNLSDVNRLLYVKDRGYYYLEDILSAYQNRFYDNNTRKWDFTKEEQAIVRIYEEDKNYIAEINAGYDYVENHLNSGSPCEYYGVNGLSEGWVATSVKNEYRLSEIFSNHYGNFRVPELSWGSYVVIETTTPKDVFTADPIFFTITDTSASINRSKKVSITDTSIVASLILVKRDAQSGQDIKKVGTSYRIWDYTNNCYVSKYILGENGAFSVIAQRVFSTDKEGRINAVASLECGKYRIEELSGPNGYHNIYWDYGNGTKAEYLGGIGEDADVATEDNMFQKYYGTLDFEVTTERLYKSSGIVSSDNLDFLYIGENYYNDEIQGKLNIIKTGEVLVGYQNTDDIEYADEYTDVSEEFFSYSKSMMRERSVFESMKDYYDLGTDKIDRRTIIIDGVIVESITPISYIARDAAGMSIAAIYTNEDGIPITMNGGFVYTTGVYQILKDGTKEFYPGAILIAMKDLYVYEENGSYVAVQAIAEEIHNKEIDLDNTKEVSYSYYDLFGEKITDQKIITKLLPAAFLKLVGGEVEYVPLEQYTEVLETDGYVMIVYEMNTDIYEQAVLEDAEGIYIYSVRGNIMDTSYLVKETEGILVTNDYGVLKEEADGTYTLTYMEAIYDPDINYNYNLTFSNGSTKAVKLVTGDMYLSEDNEIIIGLSGGGYSIEAKDGTLIEDKGAVISLAEENTGSTFDFVYEERRLAGATYIVKAAEDIKTQDGGDNYWFRKGDVVATVTTANDGEIVSFAPAYNTGGTYNSTYYYGNSNGVYDSLTKENSYVASAFKTTGEVLNKWIVSRMSSLDISIFGIPAFDEDTIYPNTYYREEVKPIYRRILKEGISSDVIVTDYQTRLEAEVGLSSEGCQVLTSTGEGFLLINHKSVEYKGAVLKKNGDYYLLEGTSRSGEIIDIEVYESDKLFEIIENLDSSMPWAVGDYVEKTASGYRIMHTQASEIGVASSSTVDGAYDIGFTTIQYYENGILYDNGNGYFTLYDSEWNQVAKVKSGVLVTEAGGVVTAIDGGYCVDYEVTEEITNNQYVMPTLTVKGATLTIKDKEYDLSWDSVSQTFKTKNGVEVTFTDDFESIMVTTKGIMMSYRVYDILMEYELHYAQKEDIVRVEKDGTLGQVSLYLPLGSYTVEEVATPYGFLINEQIQTVTFEVADQVKEIVFNTNDFSTEYTDNTMDIWKSKGLTWFVGGLNTIGEKMNCIFGNNFFTWETYGDGEISFYGDKEGFINFFDLRVKAWSEEEVPEPDNSKITISKKDITSLEELSGATLMLTNEDGNVIDTWVSTDKPHTIVGLKDGIYILTELSAPNGYEVAESITFTVTDGKTTTDNIVMYNAPAKKGVAISKQDIISKKELPGAELVVTDENGKVVDSWISGKESHMIENLTDGKYTLTEITAPNLYAKAESIIFTMKDGVAYGGDVVMYDAPDEKKIYISKQDIASKEELSGAKLIVTDENGKTIDSWTSTGEVHVIEGLKDGNYLLTEIIAPDSYEKAESISFKVVDGKAVGGAIVMYDRKSDKPEKPEDDRHPEPEEKQWKLGVGIYKADEESGESLKGAKFGLYTSDDIYNVDGKLIVTKGTLLAVATTDETGHANFAVDIALMSKNLDAERAEYDLVYEKTISYTYNTLTNVTGDVYLLSADGCDEILIQKQSDDIYKSENGTILIIEENTKTVTYTVNMSIDGNTAVNTGKFYIKELTPPDGYLYDDTEYDVEFVYDDKYTMYIPVYAKHQNEKTKVTLNKMDLTGQEEVPGAIIAVYKIKDINEKDEDGLISHADDNLILIDEWVSTDIAHETTGLLLSNTEWPRLSNQEVRENIYIFREVIPAVGYVRAKDIEFKLYQIQGEHGWVNPESGKPYGYEVFICMNYCDQEYDSGSIISPNEHADSWLINGSEKESTWDYTKVLDAYTEVKWLLVNKNLVLFFEKDTNSETIAKILKEEDFLDMDFDTVYLEFGGENFAVDFYIEKQVEERSEDSYLHYNQMWYILNDIHVTMYDDTTKLTFDKKDIVTGEDVIGAKLEIWDENGNVIDSWVTQIDEDGNVITHNLEGVLEVDKEYTLVEIFAPTEDGYVKSNTIKFKVEDDGHIQKVVMQDDFTKLQISKMDITTGKEIDGAMLEIWSTDENGKKLELIEKWITGEDGYDEDGYPKAHYIDYLPTGSFVLVEIMAPEGYLLAEDIPFVITETGILQKVQMFDATRTLKVYKYKTGTTQFVKGATIQIYEVPEQYVKYLTDRIQVDVDASFADLKEDIDFVVNKEVMSSKDLAFYLTGVRAEGTEHRDIYETKLTLQYSMLKEDLKKEYSFTQYLPGTIMLDEDDLFKELIVRDEGEDAFICVFGKDENGYTITVTFDEEYVKAENYDVYNFYVTCNAMISDTSVGVNGNILVAFTEKVELEIAAKDIIEVDSSLTEPVVTIKLTEEDLRKTIKTTDKAINVNGLSEGWYIALETQAPSGYILDKTPQVFKITNMTTEQALTFYNKPKKSTLSGGGDHEDIPDIPEGPGEIGKLILKFGNGWSWNNVRTEDSGEEGSSIILTIEGENGIPVIYLVAMFLGFGCMAVIWIRRKRNTKQRTNK